MPCDCDRFIFDDGGVYQGDYEAGKSHGFGIYTETGSGRTEYAGAWKSGYELSGVYTWNSGRNKYAGQWSDGKRHGSGVEKRNDWIYRGEWSNGFRGRYGVRESCANVTKYEGTWTSGLQDGYGVETYTDGGVYQGQWLRGLRHGYGTRISSTYSKAAAKHKSSLSRPTITSIPRKSSLNPFRINAQSVTLDLDTVLRDRNHRVQFLAGGFVLVDSLPDTGDESRRGFHRMRLSLRDTMSNVRKSKTGSNANVTVISPETTKDAQPRSSNFFRQRPSLSAIDGHVVSSTSTIQNCCTRSSFVDLSGTGIEILDGTLVEKYQGEWKQDKRTGYGVCQRSDGLKYEGEWMSDRKHGYGITTLQNGKQLVGKYKNNVLVSSAGDLSGARKRFDFLSLRSSTIRERAESAVQMAQTAANNAMQKSDIAVIRMSSAKLKADEAELRANDAEKNEQSASFRVGEIYSFDSKPGANLVINRQLERNQVDYELGFPGLQELRHPVHVAPKRFSLFTTKKQKRLEAAEAAEAAERELVDRKHAADAAMQRVVGSFLGDQPALHLPTSISNQSSPFQLPADPSASRVPAPSGSSQNGVVLASDCVTVEAIPVPTLLAHRAKLSNMKPATDRQSSAPEYNRSLTWVSNLNCVERYDRRNSLPSIYKQKTIESAPVPAPTTLLGSPPPPADPKVKTETYVVVKGVRKRVQSLFDDPSVGSKKAAPVKKTTGGSALASLLSKTVHASFAVASSSSRAWSRANPDDKLENLYKIESPKMRRKGSTPDVNEINTSEVMPREEVYAMSQRKREQRIKERAETDDRRRNNEIVISFTSAKDWVALFVVIVNAGLAVVFYSLLSQP